MKAMVINKFGGPEVFELMEIPRPVPKSGYVLVKVLASSLNPIETKIRSGLVASITSPFPAVLNADFSGIVEAVGEGVYEFKAGDEVFGFAGGVGGEAGVLAEYVSVDANLLSVKPKNLDFKTAALFPLVSITAWQGIMEKSEIKENDKILIHGAAGGVGHIAVQLAKIRGARVYATVSGSEKERIAKELGADYVINYKDMDVLRYVKEYTDGCGFDAVFDTVGGNNLINSFMAVKPNGVVSTTNARVTLDLGLIHRKAISLKGVFILVPIVDNIDRKGLGRTLKQVKELIEQDKLKVLKDEKEFVFSDISKVHEYYESGKAIGKISLINDFVK
jgi:NADPH:quinone reductase